ncbi:hypothetical protein OG735_06155 [Streptomyces sp. NBC_01210]|uniref:hypothetical protein n=1 Tax=Streptomyces sp. NBC_01210 TaxID=2903774 RepID=UPI002E0E0D85|nr:hypothetical protein OG735_06155 [Streptomyces sp. NBC_01210]
MRLAHVHGREFDRIESFEDRDREFFSDLVASYGLPVDEEGFDAGRTTYAAMVSALLPALAPYDDGFDLALLAHATPDAAPGWPMSRLVRSTSRTGLAFAVSDQGVTSPFTALRLARDGVAVEDGRRALVLVAEQSAVFHRGPVPEPLRARRDAAVALVLDTSGELGTLVPEQRSGIAPGEVASLLAAYLAGATGRTGRPVVIAGAGLTGHRDGPPGGADLLTAPPGMPCAGIWSVLADELPRLRREGRTVVLADYDARLGYLGLCRVDLAVQEGQAHDASE